MPLDDTNYRNTENKDQADAREFSIVLYQALAGIPDEAWELAESQSEDSSQRSAGEHRDHAEARLQLPAVASATGSGCCLGLIAIVLGVTAGLVGLPAYALCHASDSSSR